MVSLTPNQDNARAIIDQARMLNDAIGPLTPSERIVMHMADAALMAQAKEYDCGSSTEDIVHGTVSSIGSQMANLAVGLGGCPRRQLKDIMRAAAAVAREEIPVRMKQPRETTIRAIDAGHRA